MGLDNGVYLRSRRKIEFPKELNMPEPWEGDNGYEYEICYWRKAWGLRNEVMANLGLWEDECGVYDLGIGDVKEIWRVLVWANCEEIWDIGMNDQNLFSYEEMKDIIDRQLLNLEWLIEFMCSEKFEENECQVEWLDSY